jgi:hypothetical protein
MMCSVTELGHPYHPLPQTDTYAHIFLCPSLCRTSHLRSVFRVESGLEWDRWLIVPDTVEHHGAVQHPELG